MKKDQIFVVLYFTLNLLVTHLLTNSTLNPNIVGFNSNFLSIISSFVGNFSILLMLFSIGLIFFRKNKNFYKYLITITLFLNLALVLLIYFSRSYKAMLSFYNLTLFRNPDAGFAAQIILDGLIDIITSWHVLCFLPFIILFIYIFFIKEKKFVFSYTKNALVLIISIFLSLIPANIYQNRLKKEWHFKSATPDFGVFYSGVYNYYFQELILGLNYNEKYYQNIDESINLDEFNNVDKSGGGILAGMNLFIIQAESLQNFTLKSKTLTPNLNRLIEDSNTFYFSNFHTVVGLGNTSDAEFVVNTGYYPIGDITIAWEAYDKLFDIQSLPKMFGPNYISYSYNPTIEGFYGHKYVHENFYGFTQFKGLESFKQNYPYNQNKELYLQQKWVSDEAILDFALLDGKNIVDSGKNFYIFLETISPHYPFSLESSKYPNYRYTQDIRFNNYLNQINYIDKVLYDFIIRAKEKLKDTVFIIYGDHGNTLSKKSYENLYNRKISDIDYRKILLEVPLIIVDFSGKINNFIVNKEVDTSYIFNRTLSQLDLNSTIIRLFDLDYEHLLGVNVFSDEASFAIDPKTMDLITDSFFFGFKNQKYKLYTHIDKKMMNEEIKKIKRFKIANDNFLIKKLMS